MWQPAELSRDISIVSSAGHLNLVDDYGREQQQLFGSASVHAALVQERQAYAMNNKKLTVYEPMLNLKLQEQKAMKILLLEMKREEHLM